MNGKRFFLSAVALTLAVLLCLGGALAALDPFFVVRALEEDEHAFFSNQRYEMAGLVRNQDYSAVVMGTSLVANYRASWFTQGLGKPTLKITFPSGWPEEFDTALRLAFDTHPELDTVYFGMDLNVLVRSPEEQDVDLPEYLYNTNPLDDVEYFLNKETYIQAAKAALKKRSGEGCTLDEAYIWDGTAEFSKEHSMQVYYRWEEYSPEEDPGPWVENADKHLAVFTAWIEEHPETEFNIWCAPYSILYWDWLSHAGRVNAYLTALEHAWDILSRYDNVRLYSFLDREDIITNLDNYTDYIHCSGTVTRLEAESMMAGLAPVTQDNYKEKVAALRQFVTSYDYDALFEEAPPTD